MKHSGLLKTCKVIRHISNRTKKIWVQNKRGKVRERKKINCYTLGGYITENTLPWCLPYLTSVFIFLSQRSTQPFWEQNTNHGSAWTTPSQRKLWVFFYYFFFSPILFVSLLDVWGCVCALHKAPTVLTGIPRNAPQLDHWHLEERDSSLTSLTRPSGIRVKGTLLPFFSFLFYPKPHYKFKLL